MADGQASQTTELLRAWANGEPAALDELTPRVYRELRRIAGHFMQNESPGRTMQTTALVHEAYVRLVAQSMPDWQCRSHFFGVAAHLMRQILVDHARRHRSAKRGSSAVAESLDEAVAFSTAKSNDVVALDDALNALASVDGRKCKVIELRYFGGFNVEETAQALGISVATVGREQRMAEAWLHREMSSGA